jgi:Nucleotidyl transferase AbiEii toxin, Type IV TA system
VDAFHERLARLGLHALADDGFALAGGYAVQAHGIVERPSDDVDLFATLAAEAFFPESVLRAVAAYRAEGLDVHVLVQSATFAWLGVTDVSSGQTSKVELGLDWRQHPPAVLSIGPVLSRDDAVANKVAALYSRGQARDYIDVDAARHHGGYTPERLLRIGMDHDPGFNPTVFAQALRAVRRLPLAEFTAYGLTPEAAAALKERVTTWADQLDPPPGP